MKKEDIYEYIYETYIGYNMRKNHLPPLEISTFLLVKMCWTGWVVRTAICNALHHSSGFHTAVLQGKHCLLAGFYGRLARKCQAGNEASQLKLIQTKTAPKTEPNKQTRNTTVRHHHFSPPSPSHHYLMCHQTLVQKQLWSHHRGECVQVLHKSDQSPNQIKAEESRFVTCIIM